MQVFAFGQYELDDGRFELRRDGEPLAIEPQVFDVLHYLVMHRDRVVTKNELLDNIWGDRFVSESALTSRIKAARKLIGDDGKNQYAIKTAHGRGYRFAAPVVVRDPQTALVAPPVDAPAGAPGAGADPRHRADHRPDGRDRPTDLEWPLIGRRRELEQLVAWSRDPDRGGVVLTGAAGLGKTRLAEELVDLASTSGAPTARVTGYAEARSIPLAAFAHLVPTDAVETTGDTDLDRATLFHRARTALRAETRRLLVVDDIDQLDELSRAVLASLITERTVFAVMTMRSGSEPAPTVEELVRNGHVTAVELGSLEADAVETLVHRALGGPVIAETIRQLVDASLGNPGIVRQLVESSLAAGSLQVSHGVWQLTGPLLTSPSLERLVAERLDVVDPDQQYAVELLALAGELGVDVLAGLTGDAVLEQLEQLGVLRVRTDGRRQQATLSHPLYGEIVRSRLPSLRARRLRRELADALTSLGARRRDDRVRVVAWQLDAGGEIDPAMVVQTAQLALLDGDLATAEALLARASASSTSPDVVQLRAELAFRRSDAHEVERLLASLDLSSLDDHRRVQIVRRRATNLFFDRADLHDAAPIVEAELERLGDPAARRSLEAFWAMLLANGGQVSQAIDRASTALSDAGGPVRLELLRTLGLALVHAARPLAGLELAREGQRLRAELDDDPSLPGMSMLLFVEVVALAAAGQVDDARSAAERVKREHPDAQTSWIDTAIGRLELMAGRTAAARRVLAPVFLDARANGHGQIERWVLALHASAHLLEGRPDRAEPELSRVATLEDGARALYHPEIDRAHAWLAAGRGELDRAIELLQVSAGDCEERGALGMVSALLHDVARFGAATSVADRLAEIAAASDGALFEARSLHVTGIVGNDAELLARALELFRQGGARVYAAETAADLARALERAGRTDDAAVARATAADLRRVGGIELVTPALIDV